MALCSLINLQALHAVRQIFNINFMCLCQYALQDACALAQALLLSMCNSSGAQPADCTTHTHQSCSAFGSYSTREFQYFTHLAIHFDMLYHIVPASEAQIWQL